MACLCGQPHIQLGGLLTICCSGSVAHDGKAQLRRHKHYIVVRAMGAFTGTLGASSVNRRPPTLEAVAAFTLARVLQIPTENPKLS